MADKEVVITIRARDEAERVFAQTAANMELMAGTSTKLASGLGMAGAALGGLVLGAGIKEMASGIFEAGMKAESLQNTFKAVTGSAETMRNELSFVRSESNRMGLDFYKSADAYKSILAAAKGTSLQGQEVRNIFTAVSEASTVLGLSAEDTGGILKALEQMMSKGKIQAEELRGQLGERLPGAFRIMANSMGISTSELDKMLQSGTVLSEKVLPNFAKTLHEQYKGSVADAANSSRAAVNRLSTSWEDFKVKVASSPIGSGMTGGLNLATSFTQKITEALDRSGREYRQLAQDVFNPAEFMDAFVTGFTLRGDKLVKQVQRMENELAKFGRQRQTWKEIMDFKTVEPWSERNAILRNPLPDQTELDKSIVKIQAVRKEVMDLTENLKNLYGLSNENKDKIADIDLNLKLNEQKGIEGTITSLMQQQVKLAEKISEIKSREPEYVEWITTTSLGTGMPHEVDQSYFKPPDTTGLVEAEAEYARLGDVIKEVQRQQTEMNRAMRQMSELKVAGLRDEIESKMAEQGKSAFADKEFQSDVLKLIQEREKIETDLNSLLIKRKELEIGMGNGMLSAVEWTGVRDQLAGVNEEIIQAQSRSKEIKVELNNVEKERVKYLEGDQRDLQTKIKDATDQLENFKKAAQNLGLNLDTSQAELEIQKMQNALYNLYQISPELPKPDITLFENLHKYITEIPTKLDFKMDFKASDGMAIPDKFTQIDQQYITLYEAVKQEPILGIDTSVFERKMNDMIAKIREAQAIVTSGSDFVVDTYWAMSPPLPMTEGYNKFLNMLSMIPKGMTFTVSTLMSGGMSGSNALSVYDAMKEFNTLKSQRDLWSMQANPMISDQRKGWVGMDFWTKEYMINFAKSMLAKTEEAYNRQLIQFGSTMNGLMGTGATSSTGSGSSGSSSSGGGTRTVEKQINVNFTGPWQFNIGSGPARDIAIGIADVVENEMVARIEGGRSRLVNALHKKKHINN